MKLLAASGGVLNPNYTINFERLEKI